MFLSVNSKAKNDDILSIISIV